MATKTILIVDDAAETRIFLKGIMNSLGFAYFEAKNGLDALKILNDHLIDLVILDVLMPNFDGYQTLEFINKLKQKQDIKVVFLTGKKGEIDQAKIDELKPDDFIHKTVEIQVLKTKLKKLLDGTAPLAKPAAAPMNQVQVTTSIPPKSIPAPIPKMQPTQNQTTPKPSSAQPLKAPSTSETKSDFTAKITDPIILKIKILKLTQTGMNFLTKVQLKEGAQFFIDCPKAAEALKKTGEIRIKIQKCTQEQDLFVVNALYT